MPLSRTQVCPNGIGIGPRIEPQTTSIDLHEPSYLPAVAGVADPDASDTAPKARHCRVDTPRAAFPTIPKVGCQPRNQNLDTRAARKRLQPRSTMGPSDALFAATAISGMRGLHHGNL